MLKIGIIGLGDIATKAYLPIISQRKVEVHLCTRNEATLERIRDQYRFSHAHKSLDALMSSGIDAAFVHTSTASHQTIIEQLLTNHIHVYVDKPVTYDYASTEKLVTLAAENNLLLRVGFNRRFAPAYRQLLSVQEPNMIVMQKNRHALPGDVRTFVFDDFIHVVDTLLFLFPHAVARVLVSGRKREGKLCHVVVQFVAADGTTAVGIMNRDSGTTEEQLEIFSATEKRVVHNVVDTVIYSDRAENKPVMNDWESTLHRRGFDRLIDNFLDTLEAGDFPGEAEDILLTHRMCEEIVSQLNKT